MHARSVQDAPPATGTIHMTNHQPIINPLFVIINLAAPWPTSRSNCFPRLCCRFGLQENHQLIVNSFLRIVNQEDESIDSLSTEPKNLSTGKRPMPRNNQTILGWHAGIFRSGFCPALSESSGIHAVRRNNHPKRHFSVQARSMKIQRVTGTKRACLPAGRKHETRTRCFLLKGEEIGP